MPKQIVINLNKRYSANPIIHHVLLLLVTILSYLLVLNIFDFTYYNNPITIMFYASLYYLFTLITKRLVILFKDLRLIILLYPIMGIVSILIVTWLFSSDLIFKSTDDFIYFYLIASLLKGVLLKLVTLVRGGKNDGARV